MGGQGRTGILVRTGKSLDSTELRQRLAPGSVVEELDHEGNRLHYSLVSGSGPEQGWVTVKYNHKVLLRMINDALQVDDASKAVPLFCLGDPVHVWSFSNERWAEDGVVRELAREDTVTEGQRVPRGSVLVVYDRGVNTKWVSPEEQEQILKRMPVFVAGDRVHVWSVNAGRWVEDGRVQEVASEGMVIDGQEVPVGSTFVVYNNGQGMKCVPPSELSQVLRLDLPAPAWFGMGEHVHVWSVNASAWIEDGVVEQIAAENVALGDLEVARGAVFVRYNKGSGMKWVMPWEQDQLLRPAAHQPSTAKVVEEREQQGPAEDDVDGDGDLDEAGTLVVAIDAWEPDEETTKRPAVDLTYGTVLTILKDGGDGWLYGKRTDGSKGWFPADKVKPEAEFCFNNSDSDEEEERAAEQGVEPLD